MFRNPKYETASAFYPGRKPANKPFLTETISAGREGQLQKQRWTDRVFAGDSIVTNGRQAMNARRRELDAEKDNKPKVGRAATSDHRSVYDRLFPKKTVSAVDPNSLEGKIDLARVRDARRALRRKYAVRNNVDAIFDKYDGGKKGFIDMYDLIR